MSKTAVDDYVLPRPVERLPDYANAKSRQTLADRITDAFGLSHPCASAIANAVVDPSEVRKSIGEPGAPDVERIPVPGGTLLGIRTSVWARRIMPDPRNPRTLPSRRHPFAVDPGTAGEDSKFRPVPEPMPLDTAHPLLGELAVDLENRHHLVWATQQAKGFVLAVNDWRESIASQGVMEAVWLVATTYQHADGSAPAATLTTVEGSSRTTAVHDLLKIHSEEIPYDDNEAKLRNHVRRLNDVFDRGERNKDLMTALRCERLPALILVGFRPHPQGGTGFPTAVKSLVALRHVDPPKAWGEGPENEALSDEVLDELYRRALIPAAEKAYYAASCTRAEAEEARLPADPAVRAARIVHLFTGKDDAVGEAIRVAVTSQSTRKRISTALLNELATALVLRAVAEDRGKVDQIRRYLRYAYGKSVHRAPWESTNRSTDQLVSAALSEVRAAIAKPTTDDPGPASLELAVRAAYPLVVSGRLNADRGTANNQQPDRRTPGELLEAMRRTVQGVHQLGQALRDFAMGIAIQAVDEDGNLKMLADGSGVHTVNDIYLRYEFPPPGKAKAASVGDTPTDRYNNAVGALGEAIAALDRAFTNLDRVTGDDGQPLVEARGLDTHVADPWRDLLNGINEDMLVWARTFRKVHGTKRRAYAEPEGDEAEQADPYAGRDEADEERQSISGSIRIRGRGIS